MQLIWVDWLCVIGFFAVSLAIGLSVARRAGTDSSEFFLGGRSMPWWLLGTSMVATTFSTDTPNLVTDIVRQNGVAGNWVWWAFLITGMLTVFVYARLWRRLGVLTDLEFYELRYSGKTAAFLRGFRALYLGLLLNVMIMAAVTLAAIKIGAVMLGFSPMQTILVASIVTVVFSTAGGLRGVVLTDFLLFIVAMIGAVAAAVIAIGHADVEGLAGLLHHPNVAGKLNLLPDPADTDMLVSVLIVPLAVQWWASWYPGAEPGGGGYIVQRMLSARDEQHATGATLFFNVAHYALRPWPWILVALASLVVFPDLDAIRRAFPHLPEDKIGHDLAYPAMLTLLPAGLLGLVIASLIAAYMSTISTHLNWGSSYLVNDVWQRFIRPGASPREQVLVGRVCTVVLMALGAGVALLLQNALQAFNLLLLIGAGTGLLFLLRWFWWRVNALSELAAMVSATVVGLGLRVFAALGPEAWALPGWGELLINAGVTTLVWLAAALWGPATDQATLRRFYRRTQPGGPGWRRVVQQAEAEGETLDDGGAWTVPLGLVCAALGSVAVYATLFATGCWMYGRTVLAIVLSAVAALTAGGVAVAWRGVVGQAAATTSPVSATGSPPNVFGS